MFQFTFGDVGSGKSLNQADTVLWLLERSVKIEKKHKLPLREVWCNFHMAEWVYKKYPGRLFFWHNPIKMIGKTFNPDGTIKELRKNFDCVWDELAVELPSDKWKDTPLEVRAFFAQHRKRAIQIYGNTQDYMMVDINARRMATRVFESFKIVGSPDPDPTFPAIKHPWGIVAKWELDKRLIRADAQDRIRLSIIPRMTLITKRLCGAYDTTEDIRPAEYEIRHIEYGACPICGEKIKNKHIVN